MSEPYIGEIRLFPYNFVPQGWLPCDGSMQPINTYQPLYALIANIYGTATQTQFYLPDLRGRAAMSPSNDFPLALKQGSDSVTLDGTRIPQHNHDITANAYASASNVPASNMRFGTDSATAFMTYKAPSSNPQPAQMASGTLSVSGTTPAQPHENRQPFLALQFCICWDGVWPENPN